MSINLLNTEAARSLDRICEELAKGNEGYAEVERLEVDGTTLHFKVKIRHLHRVKVPLNGKVTVYSLTTHAEGSVDVKNPDPDDIKFCVKTPFGEVCATLEDIIKIVITLI